MMLRRLLTDGLGRAMFEVLRLVGMGDRSSTLKEPVYPRDGYARHDATDILSLYL